MITDESMEDSSDELMDESGDESGDELEMFEAIKNNDLESVMVCMSKGFDIYNNLDEDESQSALSAAVEGGNMDIIDALVNYAYEFGYDKNIFSNPLYIAIVDKKEEVVELLLRCGADPNLSIPNHLDNTMLHYAMISSNKPIIEMLLDYGAMPNVYNNRNKLPYELEDLMY